MKKVFFIVCLFLGSISTFAQRDLGYRGFADVSVGIGVTTDSKFMVGLSTVHGWQLTPNLFLGGGIAANDIAYKDYDESNDAIVVPLFGAVRCDFGKGSFTPFAEVRSGYDFICGNGFYLNPSVGIHYAKKDNFGYNLSLGYAHQGTKNPYYVNDKEKNSLGYLLLKFGIDF